MKCYLPIEPFETWFARYHPAQDNFVASIEETQGRPSSRRLAAMLDTDPKTVREWRRTGIPVYTCDRIAITAGINVTKIWPDWWEYAELADLRLQPWFAARLRRAREVAWRERVDCDGPAGDRARRMFDEEGAA